MSDPLPAYPALPLFKGEKVLSPLKRGTAAKRQGVIRAKLYLQTGTTAGAGGGQSRQWVT